jgi:hypothetical protein
MKKVIKHGVPIRIMYGVHEYKCVIHNVGYSYAALLIKRVETYHRPKWYFFGPYVECKKEVVVYQHGDLAGQGMMTMFNANEYDYDKIAKQAESILDQLAAGVETVDHIKL